MISTIRLVAAAFILTIALATTLPMRAEAQEQQVKIALHWNAPVAAFIPYYAGIKKGFYKNERINLELLPLSGSSTVITAVSAGNAPFGQAGAETIISGLAKDANVKAIFLLYQSNPNGIIVTKKSGITTVNGLRGKTISSSIFGAEAKMLNARLRAAGMGPDDLKILNVTPGAKLTMMLTGQADSTSGQINFQYIQAQMQGADVAFLPFSTPEMPLYGHSIIVNSQWVNANADLTRRFIRGTVQGLVWAKQNMAEAIDLVVTWDTSLNVDRELVKRDWEIQVANLISGGLASTQGLGHMADAGWSILADVLEENIKGKQVFTNEFIPADAPKW